LLLRFAHRNDNKNKTMKLRIGYLISGICTGVIILISFIWSLPDGKLKIVFCDVGQGDAAYVRFPDGRDMVVDGGPNNRVIECLGRHMPFWDRHLDIVMMTHPQKDHMQGLIAVLSRYQVQHFVRSDVVNTTEGYVKLMDVVRMRNIEQRFMTQGEAINLGDTSLLFLWPTEAQLAKGMRASQVAARGTDVLGTSTGDLNDYSLVFTLRYGDFDVLFTGDADTRVEANYRGIQLVPSRAEELADERVEVLKVPHHGSKTGMTEAFAQWISPSLGVISVGKNSYGHPSKEIVDMLQSVGSRVMRTDMDGDIIITSDGKGWIVD
jgi:competence protein ComEC